MVAAAPPKVDESDIVARSVAMIIEATKVAGTAEEAIMVAKAQ